MPNSYTNDYDLNCNPSSNPYSLENFNLDFNSCFNPDCTPIPSPPSRELNALTSTFSGNQTVYPNGLLSFNLRSVLSGCKISHIPPSSNFIISCPGIYEVSFNSSAFIPNVPKPFPLTLVIKLGADNIPGTFVNVNLGGDLLQNISVTALFRVCPNQPPLVLNVVNLTESSPVVYTEASVTIIKLA